MSAEYSLPHSQVSFTDHLFGSWTSNSEMCSERLSRIPLMRSTYAPDTRLISSEKSKSVKKYLNDFWQLGQDVRRTKVRFPHFVQVSSCSVMVGAAGISKLWTLPLPHTAHQLFRENLVKHSSLVKTQA